MAPFPLQEAQALQSSGFKVYRTTPYGCAYSGGGAAEPGAEFGTTRQYNTPLRYGESYFRWVLGHAVLDEVPECAGWAVGTCCLRAQLASYSCPERRVSGELCEHR